MLHGYEITLRRKLILYAKSRKPRKKGNVPDLILNSYSIEIITDNEVEVKGIINE